MVERREIWRPFPGSQERFMSCPIWECLLHGNRGGGKAQPLDSGILTPRGWKTMRDMKVGLRICNPDGSTSTVIGVFPQGLKLTYKISFVGGGHTYCTLDHLWYAKIANRIKAEQEIETLLGFTRGRIFTTKLLIDHIKEYPHKRPIVPVPKSVKFTHQELYKCNIDPYLIGLLLGDGSFAVKYRIGFTTTDDELSNYVERFEFEKQDCDDIGWRATTKSKIWSDIKKVGLLGLQPHEKFIPKRFLFGTEEERLSVLQGLMDTEGMVEDGETAGIFTSVSPYLAQGVRHIAHSLGGRTSIRSGTGKYKKDGVTVECKTYYEVRIVFPNTGDLFRLARKNKKCEGKTYQHGYMGRKIKSITPSKILPCQCIKVDNPNSLYITDDFIVTHNTDVLIMDFLQEVGQGHGIDYKGLLLREATTELGDVISKTKKWIPRIFPSAKFNNQKKTWTFEDGETLWLNYARVEDDYEQYHGHEYPWIGWEELTNHPFDNIYLKLMSCNRSSNSNIPRKYRATCNPSGPGHTWVKDRFINICGPEEVYTDEDGMTRTHIQSNLLENQALLKADPTYQSKLLAMTKDNKMLRDAWVFGSWDLVTGGFFTDVWDKKIHVINPFTVPRSWSLLRSFDWGSSKPWAVSYGFETNGEQPSPDVNHGLELPNFPRGSIIVPNEIYGWNGQVNTGDQATSQEIAQRVLTLDNAMLTEYNTRCSPGPADTSIWEVKDGKSIGNTLSSFGCNWTKAYKGAGSRIAGWSIIRQMLGAAKRKDPEAPHLYFFPAAAHHIRTIAIMQRDKKKPEDIDTDLEDHCMDSLRYLAARKLTTMKRRKVSH